MLRTYDFYEEEYYITRSEVDKYNKIIEDFENGKLNEKELRSLGLNALKFCIAEGKVDTLIKLISPIKFEDGYKYVMDAISIGLIEYIKELPSSIMERYANMVKAQKEDAIMMGETPFDDIPVDVLHAARGAVVLTPRMKKEIIDTILNYDMEIIGSIKIKDVLARQISGMGHPINSIRDVAYYSEVSNYLPSVTLFEKNIMTTSNDTDGCYDDLEHEKCKCEISINYDSLDEQNKLFANTIVEKGYGRFIDSFVTDGKDLMISIPCKGDETIEQVNKRMMVIVSKFHKQDTLYGVINSENIYNTILRWNMFNDEITQAKVSELLSGEISNGKIALALQYFEGLLPYVYDCKEDKFYRDPETYAKHQEYLLDVNYSSGDESITV